MSDATHELLHVAPPRECNTQQMAGEAQQAVQQSVQQPTVKALAQAVLSRNSQCNNSATEAKKACNNSATTDVLHVASAKGRNTQQPGPTIDVGRTVGGVIVAKELPPVPLDAAGLPARKCRCGCRYFWKPKNEPWRCYDHAPYKDPAEVEASCVLPKDGT